MTIPTSNAPSSPMLELPDQTCLIAGVVDLNGQFRGKRLPTQKIDTLLESGLRMPASLACLDIWGRDVEDTAFLFETGDADAIALPTNRGLIHEMAHGGPQTLVPLWMTHEDGRGLEIDPRQVLARVLESYAARGLTPVCAIELEFCLLDDFDERPHPVTRFNDTVSLKRLDATRSFFDRVYRKAAQQDILIDATISEAGAAQFEINLQHRPDALRIADDTILLKRLIQDTAREFSWRASFMAKPFADQAGNGLHVHFSVVDQNEKNIFADTDPLGSPALSHAIAGCIKAMPASMAIFAPHLNSYRRFTASSHAPVSCAWGVENRTTSLRLPGGSPASRRVEHRVAGADANPYLILAAILGAALEGMDHKRIPPPAIIGDAYAQDLPLLPTEWVNAVELFSTAAAEDLPFLAPALVTVYTQLKQQEMARWGLHISAFEYATYFESS